MVWIDGIVGASDGVKCQTMDRGRMSGYARRGAVSKFAGVGLHYGAAVTTGIFCQGDTPWCIPTVWLIRLFRLSLFEVSGVSGSCSGP